MILRRRSNRAPSPQEILTKMKPQIKENYLTIIWGRGPRKPLKR